MEVLFPLIRALKIDPWKVFYPEWNDQNAAFRQMQLLLKECSEEEIEVLLPVCKTVSSYTLIRVSPSHIGQCTQRDFLSIVTPLFQRNYALR